MPVGDKIYAVIDTNVFVSALLSRNGQSNPAMILNKILDGVITPLYNDEILDEYRQVLSRPKFSILSPSEIEGLLTAVKYWGINTERTPVKDEMFPDPDDIVFYEIKMSVEDSYLVTGNLKHFPQKPFVVTPAQMIEMLSRNQR